jgi:hypothetical protein
LKCSIVSQLISFITGAFVEEEDREEEDDCNEESRGEATIQVIPKPKNTATRIPTPITIHFFDLLAK